VTTLARLEREIVRCRECPRLVKWREEVAATKRAAFRDHDYWGKPVPGFGDASAGLIVLGLAPAAHGANRTGRVFTGDGQGGSSEFLMAALHRAGFANIPTSTHRDDGLRLTDAFITSAVRCAPPENKPLPAEIARCAAHLDAEVDQLPRVRVVVALGRIAFDAWLQRLRRHGVAPSPRPAFGHGVAVDCGAGQPLLVGCYHPSRQNTNTGTLTPGMMDAVLDHVKARLKEGRTA